MVDVAVTFEPALKTVWVEPGVTVLDAAQRAGVGIEATCAGRGTCGACGVRVVLGELAPLDDVEQALLGSDPGNVRLACRARVAGPVTVRPLIRSAVEGGPTNDGPPTTGHLVVGVDLGTTTVVAVAVDTHTGVEHGRATVPNAQRSFGADVVSRISAAVGGHGDELRSLAFGSIEQAIVHALGETNGTVDRVVVAGNTAMGALLQGLPVGSLAAAPFDAPDPWPGVLTDSFSDDRLRAAVTQVLPPLAAFVGGDILAGVWATGLVSGSRPALLLDVGTNAEIALATHDGLLVASGPAGPAFEGEGVGCAGPASPGGVTAASFAPDGTPVLHAMGSVPPKWFTGSGLVSAIALLRRSGLLDESGRLLPSGPLESHVSRNDGGVLQVDFGHGIVLTQLDIRAVQLAVAAVRVTVATVLDEAGLSGEDLAVLHVAGAFGSALDPVDLIDLGIVPASAAGAVRLAHNTSLAGAVSLACMQASGVHEAVDSIRESATAIDLVSRAGFNAQLLGAMRFERF